MKKILVISLILLMCFSEQARSGDHFSVHGYLTQAYAFSRKHQIFGIPKEGTADYRNLALQFRFESEDRGNFVIQFSHKRMGLSPLMLIEEDVRLDWGFFEYYLSDATSIKLGKLQMPLGIYNEIRDVGVILPFFSIPYSPYGEGNYMSETVDGILLAHSMTKFSPWNIDFNFFAGHWNWLEWRKIENPYGADPIMMVDFVTINHGFGSQMWLDTPLDGLRFGLGALHGDAAGGLSFVDGVLGPQCFYAGYLSVDGYFERFFVRSEIAQIFMENANFSANSFYVQAGIKVFNQLSLNLQMEIFQVKDSPVPKVYADLFPARTYDFDFFSGQAIGLKYDFSYNFVIKVEAHWCKSLIVEDKVLNFLLDDPVKSFHSIISVSTSF